MRPYNNILILAITVVYLLLCHPRSHSSHALTLMLYISSPRFRLNHDVQITSPSDCNLSRLSGTGCGAGLRPTLFWQKSRKKMFRRYLKYYSWKTSVSSSKLIHKQKKKLSKMLFWGFFFNFSARRWSWLMKALNGNRSCVCYVMFGVFAASE